MLTKAVAAGLAVSLLAAACSSAPSLDPDRANVLLIVIDTLRADHLGCYGHSRNSTPAIDRLASTAVRFDRAYAAAPWTVPSVASMLSGLYPSRHSATSFDRMLPDDVETLAEILGEKGYDTAGVISHIAIDARHNFDQGFEVYLESEAQGHDHVSTPGVTRQAVEQLERLSRGAAPFLLFVHYFDPHYNYKRHPEFGFAAPSAGRLDGEQPMRDLLQLEPEIAPNEVGFLRDLYDEEVRFTDAGVERLLAELDELGLAENTFVILTSDHGEEFHDHGSLGHTRTLYDELIRVPLIVRAPAERTPGPGVVEQPVSLVSLTPTILDLLGMAAGAPEFQAPSLASLLGGGSADPQAVVFSEVDFVPLREGRTVGEVHKKSLIAGRYKLVRDDVARQFELFDLIDDPQELVDLERLRPAESTDLREQMDRLIDLARSGALEPRIREVETPEIDRLRSLGYVGD